MSFFGSFDLAISFGPVTAAQSSSVVVDIDPLADRAPLDMTSATLPGATDPVLPRQAPVDQAAWFQRSVGDLLGRIWDYYWGQAAPGLVRLLNDARGLPPARIYPAVREVLGGEKQRIYNLSRKAVAGIAEIARQQLGTPPEIGVLIAEVLEGTLAEDPGRPTGLSIQAEASVELVLTAIASAVAAELRGGQITAGQLREHLEGERGVTSAAKTLADILLPQVAASLASLRDA
jgi:hypothetical protein